MKLLNDIMRLRRDINALDERIIELYQMTQPKAQKISDMPRGGERKNAIEEYIVKSEQLQHKLAHKRGLLKTKWEEFCDIAKESGVTEAQKSMLYFRFHEALPWKTCVTMMGIKYPAASWNEQKLFRMYRKILYKIDKNAKKSL